jgi:RimJ/RimL family protein N-acetyltransferase
MNLRPLDDSHDDLLRTLQQQEDVWEFIGTLPVTTHDPDTRVFAVMEGDVALGFAGLVKSQAGDRDDFELLCAMRSDVQGRGVAKQACQLVLDWAFNTAKLDRVIACIDPSNHSARAIAGKLGMTEVGPDASNRVMYVKSAAE